MSSIQEQGTSLSLSLLSSSFSYLFFFFRNTNYEQRNDGFNSLVFSFFFFPPPRFHRTRSEKINNCYKCYHEMAEAVAERLLDLHCRLISLYILNEADSLDWQSNKSFFEKERCSFVIQMWWLYMQGKFFNPTRTRNKSMK